MKTALNHMFVEEKIVSLYNYCHSNVIYLTSSHIILNYRIAFTFTFDGLLTKQDLNDLALQPTVAFPLHLPGEDIAFHT